VYNRTLDKVQMKEMFINLTYINRTPVYSEHNSLSQLGGYVQTGFTVYKWAFN